MLLIKQGVGNGKRIETKPDFNPTNRVVFVWRLEDCFRESDPPLRRYLWPYMQFPPVVQFHLCPVASAIGFPDTCPLDNDLSGGLRYPTFEQPSYVAHILRWGKSVFTSLCSRRGNLWVRERKGRATETPLLSRVSLARPVLSYPVILLVHVTCKRVRAGLFKFSAIFFACL